MSDLDRGRGWRGWLDRRYQITPLIEFLRHKEVPKGPHSMVWYYLGGTTTFFFVVQVVTGVLLLMYYQPGEATAYESIRYLTTKVPFGWLMRSIHCWSAILFLTFLALKAWDIGATGSATSPASLKAISWICAWWTIAAGVVIIGVRFWVHHHRWFFFTGAALLHVVLHGLLGLSYLVAGAMASILTAGAVTACLLRDGRRQANAGGSR